MVCLFICVEYLITVGMAGSSRGKIFTEEWMTEKFGKEHEAAFNG